MCTTIKQLYDKINTLYSQRQNWISDISNQLNIPYSDTEYLVQSLGYYRGRIQTSTTPYTEFAQDPTVQSIFDRYCK